MAYFWLYIYGYYLVIRDYGSTQSTSEQNEQQAPLLTKVTSEHQTPILPIEQNNYGSLSSPA